MNEKADALVTLNRNTQKALLIDVCQRNTIEACGVLLGDIDEQGNWHVKQAYPLRNIFASPVYFEFAPEDLLAVELEYPGQVIGVYHSHPSGFAKASSTDRENMKRVNQDQDIPWVWLIIRGPFDDVFRKQEYLPLKASVAYHHYKQGGLHTIPIGLE